MAHGRARAGCRPHLAKPLASAPARQDSTSAVLGTDVRAAKACSITASRPDGTTAKTPPT
jgi:hypothetical protein